MSGPVQRVVLYAKEPVAGRVKTRLAREIGDAAAAALYAAFLEDLAVALPAPGRWEAVLAHAEPEAGPFLRKTFGAPWTLSPQGDGSLGMRLRNAFEGAHVVVAGSDAPTLGRTDLEEAFGALAGGADVVFAPSPDGGFSLIGTRKKPGDFLEGVRWSTEYALDDARRAAERLGLRVALIAPVPDVDVLEDLGILSSSLSKQIFLCPATRRAVVALQGRVLP
jgi:rSAM/selenodomain-associated transferase 1